MTVLRIAEKIGQVKTNLSSFQRVSAALKPDISSSAFEKGNFLVRFEITFPAENFAPPEDLQKLEKLLPPRPKIEIPTSEFVEEVDLEEFD
uniref:DnaJ-like protein subfamily A member 2 n=1 Tax=Magallana gigas TaxID=29159 RepID=K1QBN1_MAGGI